MSSDKFLVFKVTYKEVTRKVPVTNEDLTFDDFMLMMERVFEIEHSSSPPLSVKYLDEDKDWITITTTEDLRFALSTNDTLKIELIPPVSPIKDYTESKMLVTELSKLRASIDSCISRLSQISSTQQNSQTVVECQKLTETFAKSLDIGSPSDLKSDLPNQRNPPMPGNEYSKMPIPSNRPPPVKPGHQDNSPQFAPYQPPSQGYDPTRARSQMSYEQGPPPQRMPLRPELSSGPSQISTMDPQALARSESQFPRDHSGEKPYSGQQLPPAPYGSSQLPPRQMQPPQGYQPPMRPQYPYNPQVSGPYPAPPGSYPQPRHNVPLMGNAPAPRPGDNPYQSQYHQQ